MHNQHYVYMLTNKYKNVFYVGITNDIYGRIWEHKTKTFKGFSSKYNIDRLVYYEIFEDVDEAITKEKKIKRWNREWKVDMINDFNPTWKDLYNDIKY